MVAAAIGGAAVAGIGSSLMSSSAAKSAANTQAAAANQAAALQAQQQAQVRADLAPYNTSGQVAQSAIQDILGRNGAGPQASTLGQLGLPSLTFNPVGGTIFAPTQAQLESTPGYQFDLAQGRQAVANSNAAQGLGLSGAALKGAANYATGLANNTLTTQQGIFNSNLANQQSVFQQNFQNVLGALQSQAQLGENAGAQTGTLGTQSAMNQANLLTSGAAAKAAGTVGSANALSSGLNSIGNLPLNYLLLNNGLGSSSGAAGIESGGWDL